MRGDMIVELSLATAMVLATVTIHGTGLMILGRMLASLDERWGAAQMSPLSWHGWFVTVAVVMGLFLLHGLEIWLYALLFSKLGAVPEFREAVYFSTSSYGSIGYGDSAISGQWKLLGAIEGINGSILLGWSVAFFVTVMARMLPPLTRR